jgi:hypothetical protein
VHDKKNIHTRRATHLHILKAVLLTYAPQNIFLAAFLQFTSQKEFVEDEVCFLEVEDNIQLANIAIVFVHLFNVAVNDFKGDQFIIGGSTAGDEEKRSISTVDNFRVWCESKAVSAKFQVERGKSG